MLSTIRAYPYLKQQEQITKLQEKLKLYKISDRPKI